MPAAATPRSGARCWNACAKRILRRLPLQDGISPAWPLDYAELEPYYQQAEQLYRVHGKAGVDPTEPPRQSDFCAAPKPVEPFCSNCVLPPASGRQPYDIPISWSDDADDPSGDAQLFGLQVGEPKRLNVHDNARVLRLHVNPSGRAIRAVEADVNGDSWLFSADVVVLAAGAINTPAILMRSINAHHPKGIGNGSDQVGRNLMKPQLTSILQLAAAPNSGRYPRSFGVNDYYWGDKNVSFPLGHIQSCGGVLQDALFAESPPVLSLVTRLMPNFGLEELASRSVAWWAMSEVLPDPHNKVYLQGDQLRINYIPNNREAHDRLVYRWIDTLKAVEADPDTHVVRSAPTHPRGEAPISVMGYACGTCRMGSNPATSVVDLQGRSHEIDNLYIADASVFPSCPSIGPGLTVIANALRLGEQLAAVL